VRYCVGIDLGSTTTKAVALAEDGAVLGRGITNSRSNYDLACKVALGEALVTTRFGLVGRALEAEGLAPERRSALLAALDRGFRLRQYLAQVGVLRRTVERLVGAAGSVPAACAAGVLDRLEEEAASLYGAEAHRRSDFFRDLAGSRWTHHAEAAARRGEARFDALVALYDKAILEVENTPAEADAFASHAGAALAGIPDAPAALRDAVDRAASAPLEQASGIGTGYGRRRLPFPKERIRSEILCHGLGAHAMFPGTRTVLDIGGQDTKAIQVDADGIVTSFQMNDRCAAGCGRYLGYIADEMNLGLHELGPLAQRAERTVRINSTCTVFAGAELRERLSLGERREDILAGLHRAIVLRALSLLARSGGVRSQFTFTGGVARNPAAVRALRDLVREGYGEIETNISDDSIYTGALGAALFAWREASGAAAPRAAAEAASPPAAAEPPHVRG
jgi:benzoyl-CoA reductase subunit A